MSKSVGYFILLLIIGAILFGSHYFILNNLDLQGAWSTGSYSLSGLYLFEGIASSVMLIIILVANTVMPKNIGFIFLGLLTLKMAASFLYVNKGLNKMPENFLEYNFLAVFFAFLVYDVFITYKVINQENK
ncbi:hypothetical protein [Sphingobacterium sp. SYP-B4668]|uniref:hypothetical protein n=1 Tax=Sphingobacterium sp. SYP-B4668 TaxID=2996035 RepID=UPI0022DCE806|nr:hypothetical protein [Sphingobacterium sp. SYP-B4668]